LRPVNCNHRFGSVKLQKIFPYCTVLTKMFILISELCTFIILYVIGEFFTLTFHSFFFFSRINIKTTWIYWVKCDGSESMAFFYLFSCTANFLWSWLFKVLNSCSVQSSGE
jgi:hypothetical protein